MNPPAYQFIDANLLMYSLGGPHPLRDPCKKILDKIKKEEILAVSNTEVLQEILYRYFSIGRSTLGEIAYQAMVQICVTIFPVTIHETNKALEILKSLKDITSRDAIHAATMLNNGIKEIISTDPHFDLISEVKRIDPTEFK
ncbi:MAG: type II toxin-antitoxin system VapC family toxin [Thermodesulfobacteriota bacterium]